MKKLAACYTIFNGLELLNGSIKQIENEVDLILIAWQSISNKGHKSEEIKEFIKQYKGNKKIKLIEFSPRLELNTKQNELNKHNQILNCARDYGCSHFLMLACDHYYKPKEFRKAKKLIKENSFDLTLSNMFTYYKRPDWRINPPESYLMPFICKIERKTRFVFDSSYPFEVDPSLKLHPYKNDYVFKESELMLHHFSMIRQDIENKFNNAAASIRWNPSKINNFIKEYNGAKLGDEISYFKGRKLIKVKNFFDIQ